MNDSPDVRITANRMLHSLSDAATVSQVLRLPPFQEISNTYEGGEGRRVPGVQFETVQPATPQLPAPGQPPAVSTHLDGS